MQLVYQYFGNGIALGMYGSHTDIQMLGNYLFNHGATVGEIHFIGEGFGYVLTDKDKLKRGIANGAVNARSFENVKGPHLTRPELWAECLAIGEDFVERLAREDFLEQDTIGHVYQEPKLGKHEL